MILTTELSTVSFLRNLEVELGGSFQVQANKDEWGVGTDGQLVTYLSELTDEEVESAPIWFSNRLFNSNAATRLSKDAQTKLKFIRFDMERTDHSVPTNEEVESLMQYFQQNNARAAVRTPRGVHGYIVLSEALTITEKGESPVKALVKWFLKDYQGPLVPDVPSWSRSNVSRFVTVLSFHNEGALVLTPTDDVMGLKSKGNGKTKATKLATVCASSSSFADVAQISAMLRGYVYGKSTSTISAELGIKEEKVQDVLNRYAKPELKGTKNEKDEVDLESSDYRGKACQKRNLRQKTFKRYADRWWSYQDFITNAHCTPEVLKGYILVGEEFSVIRTNIMTNYKLNDTNNLAEFIDKDVDAQQVYDKEHEDVEVSKAVMEDVELVISVMPAEFATADICDSISHCCRRQVLRAIKQLGYIIPNGGKGPSAGWINKNKQEKTNIIEETINTEVIPEIIVPKATVKLPDFDNEIVEMLPKCQIEILLGPGGSGKTYALENEILLEDYTPFGSLVPEKKIVEATILAPSNEIAIELQFNRLKRKVTTIHSGLDIPVIQDMNEFHSIWFEKSNRAKLVCIDEFSLVSKFLFWAILKRITAKKNGVTKLVILGDDAQLPPVSSTDEEGSYPLRDLVALADAGVPNIKIRRFTGNRRVDSNSTGLLAAIDAVRQGQEPTDGPGFELRLINEQSSYVGEKVMNNAANTIVATGWQGLSALKGGVYGEKYGSQLIANKVVGSKELKIGDAVVCMKTDRRNSLAKGAKGTIVKMKTYGNVSTYGVKMDCLHKGVLKKLTKWLSREELSRQECRNAHTVQGSQGDNFVVTLEKSRITTREMLYVQLSRAKKNVILITTKTALEQALSTTSDYSPSAWSLSTLVTNNCL
jgi:hypothetical protein